MQPAHSPHLLVLDDEPANLHVLQRLFRRLEPFGRVEVTAFLTGTEALDWCARHRPDLCLLDHRMPAMSGFEFLQRLRALPGYATLPVILLTGSVEREVVERAYGQGVIDVVMKPFEPRVLRERIAGILETAGFQRS